MMASGGENCSVAADEKLIKIGFTVLPEIKDRENNQQFQWRTPLGLEKNWVIDRASCPILL